MRLAVTTAPAGLGRRGRSFARRPHRRRSARGLARLLFVACAIPVLAVVEHGIRFRRLPDLCRTLGIRLRDASQAHDAEPGLDDWREVTRTARRASRIVARWPFGDTCLRRALLIATMTRDLDPCVVIGVKRGESGDFLAHAWVEIAGVSIDPQSADYTSFDLP